MKSLAAQTSLPFVFFDNFNEILRSDENEGGVCRSDKEMFDFRQCVDDCNVLDLGFRGSCFTWCRGKNPSTFVRERLDRFLATLQWVCLFPNCDVRHFPVYKLDHSPILLNSKSF